MAKDLSGATTALIAIDAQQKRPVLLFTLFLTSPTLTLRICAYNSNLIFGGNTFTAKAVIFDGVNQSLEGQIGRVTIKIDNVSTDMAAYSNAKVFEGRRLFIQRIYLDSTGNPPSTSTDYVEIFDGNMETPSEIGKQWLTVSATSGKSLQKKTLSDTYSKMCRHTFGGTMCNLDGLSDLTVLTATGNLTGAPDGSVSASGTTMWDSGTLTQSENYWNFGRVDVGLAGTTYTRIVSGFYNKVGSGVTFDLSVPVALTTDFRYVIYKGCSKVLMNSCTGLEAYGPTADNSRNFGGFIHIGNIRA